MADVIGIFDHSEHRKKLRLRFFAAAKTIDRFEKGFGGQRGGVPVLIAGQWDAISMVLVGLCVFGEDICHGDPQRSPQETGVKTDVVVFLLEGAFGVFVVLCN